MITSIFKLVLAVLLIAAIVVIGPIVGIWSLNTLFPILAIPYTFNTWAAFALLFGSFTGLNFGAKRK